MTEQEFNEMVTQMHQKGLTNDDIMSILLETVIEEKASIDDLELMAGWLGYTINKEKVEEIVKNEQEERNQKESTGVDRN